jgi:hypothetical protein
MNDTPFASVAPRRSLKTGLIVAALAFVLGAGVSIWAVLHWDPVRKFVAPPPVEPKAVVLQPDPGAALIAPAPSSATEQRIAALEARIATLSPSNGGGLGNSRRAEGLLIAFAARRAVDRGMSLGYLEAELTNYFGATQPKAVALAINASRDPATIAMLKAELDRVAPSLVEADPDEGLFDSVKRGLSGLFIVRDAKTPAAAPSDHVSRARQLLEIGRVDQALAEISRLPTREKATRWIAMARHNVEANQALDILEAAALTNPRPEADAKPAPESTPAPASVNPADSI